MDYDALVSISLSFGACQSKKCVNVTIVDDDVPEGTENFFVNLLRPSALPSSITLDPTEAELTIFDNDDGECIQ